MFSLKSLPISKNKISTKLDASNWDYLNHILMPKRNANVGLLIGCNYPQVLQPLEVIPSQNGGPYALKTLLGWSVIGPRFSKRPSEKICVFFIKTKLSAVCYMCMDMCSSETTEASIENKQFLAEVNDSIKLKENNHYEIFLPLKFFNLKPPPHREFSYQRLMSLKRKFLKKPFFYNDYVQFVSKMLDNNYAEKATNCEESNVWFIPHHGVYHPLKPEKIRVVFDCSARFRGFSLNNIPDPLRILGYFQRGRYVIAKMALPSFKLNLILYTDYFIFSHYVIFKIGAFLLVSARQFLFIVATKCFSFFSFAAFQLM